MAPTAERVMKIEHQQITQRRAIVLSLARDLALCGLQIDHDAIVRALQDMQGVASARSRSDVRDILAEFERFYARDADRE